MVYVETPLPRGHKRPNEEAKGKRLTGKTDRVTKPKAPNRNFGARTLPEEQKASRPRPHERRQALLSEKKLDEELTQKSFQATTLNFHKVRKSMLVLGCIIKIESTVMHVSMPGMIRGVVNISQISDAYSKRLQRLAKDESADCPTLADLYEVGQLVYMKVIDIETQRKFIYLSLNPSELHSQFEPSQLVPGLILAATITTKEDHGYTMDVGIRNVSAFLPSKNLNQNPDDVGRNLICSIVSVKAAGPSGTVLVLKALSPGEPRVLNVEEATMETIVPGCQLTFTVGEPVEHGLRGMLFEDTVPAYVNKYHLTKVTSSVEKYSMFKQLPATLLYVQPYTNEVFVSLRQFRNNRCEVDTTFVYSSVIEKAHVKSTDHDGVWFQFDGKKRALLPSYVLRYRDNVDMDITLSSFQVGTTHKVTVLCYAPIDNTYLVTNETSYTDAAIKMPEDIVCGNIYNGRVVRKNPDGYGVKIGFVYGKLLLDWCDKNRNLKLGDVIPLRAIDNHSYGKVWLTNVPSLMDEMAPILKDWNQLNESRKDQTFLGLVGERHSYGLVVKFFNRISGLAKFAQPGQDAAEMANLRPGDTRLFTVVSFDRESRKICLLMPRNQKRARALAGKFPEQMVPVTITSIHATGADVRAADDEIGLIPAECFSEFGEHNFLYNKLLREGDTLTVIRTNEGMYSIRLAQLYTEKYIELTSVRPGMILTGSTVTANGKLYAIPLLSDFMEPVPLSIDECSRQIQDGSVVKLLVQQKEGNKMKVSGNMFDVCEDIFAEVHAFIEEYVQDVKRLIELYRKHEHAFANYTIGDRVECVIESIAPEINKMAVEVRAVDKPQEYVTKGIVTPVLANRPASSYKVGQQVPGRVVWIDVERMLVHVCVDAPLFERILLRDEKDEEESYDGERFECTVLFKNSFVNVCCTQSARPGALVIIPAKHHYNDVADNRIHENRVMARLMESVGPMILALTHSTYNLYSAAQNKIESERKLVASSKNDQLSIGGIDEETETEAQADSDSDADALKEENFVEEESDNDEEVDDDFQKKDEKLPKNLKTMKKKGNGTFLLKENSVKAKNKVKKAAKHKKQEENEIEEQVDPENEADELKEENFAEEESGKRTMKKKANGTSLLKKNRVKAKEKVKKVANDTANQKPAKKRKLTETNESNGKHISVKSKKEKPSLGKADEQLSLNKQTLTSTKKSPKKVKKHSILKKKKAPFTIDQLDGTADFCLYQLDGAEDEQRNERKSKKKATAAKRKHEASEGLPGATNFWDSTPVFKRDAPSDTSDDEDDSVEDRSEAAPKKRATAKERFEAMKQEEERLRKIEEELANPSLDPHTPDQFDRLVLAQPNNSMLWIRYMAFHMESAELEKARAVGRKALKAIHFREEADRLNVWIALLNLEIRYETVDSFKEVLQEAIQYNEPFKVYTRVVDILIDCQKHVEVQELLELLLKKFRKQNDMWLLVADAWYRIGQGNKVKPLLSQALKSLPPRDHIPLIVKFAFLHNRNENRDEAHLLFEQILTSYPKRTDIWSQYIDMLVKDNLVENARQILERAIMQRLPMKNMKTLYTKYVNFEEKHGDRDSVRRVKQLAAEYVQAQLNNAGVK
uniref:S1 motif domain-containing protein n=1 Tax=Anopheles epiroticus TaxID=199890 RepID=A0A182P930_9DIPT